MGVRALGLFVRSPGFLLGGILLLWAGVLGVGQSWNFIYADDALPFVVRIHQGQTHPHHLILGILGKVKEVGLGKGAAIGETLALVRVFVAGMSLLGVAGIGLLAWRWYRRRSAMVVALLLSCAGYGFWAYSIVPDFYIPGIAAIVAAVLAMERLQQQPSVKWLLLFLFWVWVALLCHVSYAIFAVIAILVLAIHKHFKEAVLASIGSALLVWGSYLLAFLAQREYPSFWRFVVGYAEHMQFTPYDRLQWLTPVYAAVGIVRAWTFPEYFVRVDGIWEWVTRQWRMKLLLEERFLLRAFPPVGAAALGVVGLLSVGLLFLVLVVQAKRVHAQLRGSWGYWGLVGWAGALAVLGVLWEPSSNEFWLWMPPVMALLLAGVRSRWAQRMLVGAGMGLAVATAPVIGLYHSPSNDIYSVNKHYRVQLAPEDVLIAGDFQQTLALNWLYPTQAQELQFELGRIEWESSLLQRALERLVQSGTGGRLVLDPMIVMPHPSEIALRQKLPGWEEGRVRAVLQKIAALCQQRGIPLVGVWRDGGGVVEFVVEPVPGLEWMR